MKTRAIAAAAAALALAGGVAQCALQRSAPARSPALGQGIVNALGGLRSIASEVVWFRAERLQSRCRYSELAQLASILTFLEPHEPEVWIYSAWNLAYNISVKMPFLENRWPWVAEAVRLLRDEGLKWNPGSPAICRELAFLFELKIGGDNDSASPLYREEWRKLVAAAATTGDWGSLGLEPGKMHETEEATGMDDWSDPSATAAYWALEGLRTAGPRDAPFLKEVLKISRILYDRRKGKKNVAQ